MLKIEEIKTVYNKQGFSIQNKESNLLYAGKGNWVENNDTRILYFMNNEKVIEFIQKNLK